MARYGKPTSALYCVCVLRVCVHLCILTCLLTYLLAYLVTLYCNVYVEHVQTVCKPVQVVHGELK